MKSQEWQTPAIEGYGRVVDFPNAAAQPDPNKEYKVLFHITSDAEKEGVNTSLWKIARFINLMELRKVPKEQIHIIAVISGAATAITLNDQAYLERLKRDNPNLDLLKKLVTYGVTIEVCGQALAERDFKPSEVNHFTTLTLSAMIDIPTHQMEGYTIMY
ncbi:DsrE family protein [Nonlabens antarcticus]|uniref:DsrE family protein n=1 Tax=Nonlabens antarcticus TaxID=392714 RepID=UPI001891B462|nr:DsrE family protein [Nonlabens antarcticus]